MARYILPMTVVTCLLSASLVQADHGSMRREVRRQYEAQLAHLEHEYDARRERVQCDYRRQRDVVRAARTRAYRISCPHDRAERVRDLNRQLSHLSRNHSRNLRDLIEWRTDQRRHLRHDYDLALRNTQFVQVHRPVVAAHPDDCRCRECRPLTVAPHPGDVLAQPLPPRPLPPTTVRDYRNPRPVICTQQRPRPVVVHHDHDHGHHHDRDRDWARNQRRTDRAIGWANLVLNLLAN